MKRLTAIAIFALLAATTACGSDAGAPAKHSVKDGVQTLDPAFATKLKLGDDLEVVAELPRHLDGDPAYFSSDHEVLGEVTPIDPAPLEGRVSTQSRPLVF